MLKVNKKMLDEGLRSTYFRMSLLPLFFRFKWVVKLLNLLDRCFRRVKVLEGIISEERYIPSSDGTHNSIRVLIFRPEKNDDILPALLYCHGGGYIMCSPEQFVDEIVQFIRTRPCVVIVPDYRKSYTKPFPAGFNDCYETLLWAKDNAVELNILAKRFVIAGHSAGGGLTAAVTLKARDTQDVDIAFQMPIYPMIDDQQPEDSSRAIVSPVWDSRMNRIGWGAYLADLHAKGAPIPAYAAPARNRDYRGFPPTITFVGELEPFYVETADYVKALQTENIDVLYQEYAGCYHGFDTLGGQAEVSKRAWDFTYQSFAAFYDKYVMT